MLNKRSSLIVGFACLLDTMDMMFTSKQYKYVPYSSCYNPALECIPWIVQLYLMRRRANVVATRLIVIAGENILSLFYVHVWTIYLISPYIGAIAREPQQTRGPPLVAVYKGPNKVF